MLNRKITISGIGCTLLDSVYNNVSFNSEEFKRYLSCKPGDGGLSIGHLVFLDDLEKFAEESFESILRKIVGIRKPGTYNLGGPAIVSIIHAAQLSGNAADFSFIAAVGNDWIAKEIKDILKNTPLKNADLLIKNERSPFTNVFSDPDFDQGHGERTFVNNIGAAGLLNIDDIPKDFYNADILVCGGTALVPGIHDSLDELLLSCSPGTMKVVHTVYDFRNERKQPGRPWPLGKSHESFKHIDLLIMDKDEALKISGFESFNDAIKYFNESELPAFIITDGVRPVVVSGPNENSENNKISYLPTSKSIIADLKKSRLGDTTGAGDNFAGGVIYSLASQKKTGRLKPDFIEAAIWGIVSGGFACFHVGGTYIEKHANEKLEKLHSYYEKYKQQVKQETA